MTAQSVARPRAAYDAAGGAKPAISPVRVEPKALDLPDFQTPANAALELPPNIGVLGEEVTEIDLSGNRLFGSPLQDGMGVGGVVTWAVQKNTRDKAVTHRLPVRWKPGGTWVPSASPAVLEDGSVGMQLGLSVTGW